MSSPGTAPLWQFGDLLKDLRRRAGLTQVETAERAKTSVACLRDLEQGRVKAPRPGTLRRIADALELSTSDRSALLEAASSPSATPRQYQVRVLGPLTVTVGGTEVSIGSEPQRALLALLALAANRPVDRDTLMDGIWGGRPPKNPVEIFQTYLSRLRQRLTPARGKSAPVAVRRVAPGRYQLTAEHDEVDLLAFREAVAVARQQRELGDLAGACERYEWAAKLWRGEPLADVDLVRLHPWVVALAQEWQAFVIEYAELAVELGRYRQLLPLLRELTEREPLHEAAHALLLVALAGSGQQDAAMAAFARLRQRLADELGTDPGPELIGAYERILRQEISPSDLPPVTARRQLPPDAGGFTGRERELAELLGQFGERDGTAPGIVTILGMGGVGKTRLAVHAAHRAVADGMFGDLQLYVDLQGHAEQPPADPVAVLGSFLRLLGFSGSQLPHDLAGRAALYRDALRDKKALILLDNAAGERQVLPLLPAGPANTVIMTSRRTIAVDGAHPLLLDVLRPDEAVELLAGTAGADRIAGEPEVAARIVELCDRLPLAITLAGRRLRTRPAWRVTDLADRLAGSTRRHDELAVGETNLHAVFDLSYQGLAAEGRRLFRLLGLHPGGDFTADSVAALAGHSPAVTAKLLDELVDEHLLSYVTADRYRLHDLVRGYARDVVAADERDDDRQAAIDRVLHWYLYAADEARRAMFPHFPDVTLNPEDRPEHLPVFADDDAAFAWLAAEQTALATVVTEAVDRKRDDIAWRLPAVLKHYFERSGDYDLWLSSAKIGLAAARRLQDPRGEATMLSLLALVYGQREQLDECVDYLTRSRAIFQEVTDRFGEAKTLINLGVANVHRGKLSDATELMHRATGLARDIGDRYMETRALSNLGAIYTKLGRHDEAIDALHRVLAFSEREGDPIGTVAALQNLGETLLAADRPAEAIGYLRRALELYRDKHFRLYEAEVLELLGDALSASGELPEAREHWRRAGGIFAELEHPRAAKVAAKAG